MTAYTIKLSRTIQNILFLYFTKLWGRNFYESLRIIIQKKCASL